MQHANLGGILLSGRRLMAAGLLAASASAAARNLMQQNKLPRTPGGCDLEVNSQLHKPREWQYEALLMAARLVVVQALYEVRQESTDQLSQLSGTVRKTKAPQPLQQPRLCFTGTLAGWQKLVRAYAPRQNSLLILHHRSLWKLGCSGTPLPRALGHQPAVG